MISEPMQRLLNLLAEADATKSPPVEVPEKFIRELNEFGEIKSEQEFLETVKRSMQSPA